MTHTENSREKENFGSLTAEVLTIDISSLDAAGQENSVSPNHIDTVLGFAAHQKDAQGTGDFLFGWNETGSHLMVKNGTTDGAAVNNAAVNETRVTWWGRP